MQLSIVQPLVLLLALGQSFGFDLDAISVRKTGEQFHYFYNEDHISPWHDIPYHSDNVDSEGNPLIHFVCEIPKGTTAKYEIHKSESFNPIIQDKKDGKPRFYKYSDSVVNYGAIPQTWENPDFVHPDTNAGGDNDPIDVLQINSRPCTVGEVMEVKVLGCLALVDGGETDWKLIVVDARDDETKSYKDIQDVPVERVNEAREWFRMYKTAEGKGENKFGLDEKAMPRDYAVRVTDETHDEWKAMMANKVKCDFDGDACWLGEGAHSEL